LETKETSLGSDGEGSVVSFWRLQIPCAKSCPHPDAGNKRGHGAAFTGGAKDLTHDYAIKFIGFVTGEASEHDFERAVAVSELAMATVTAN
jgi:hypothetical protein